MDRPFAFLRPPARRLPHSGPGCKLGGMPSPPDHQRRSLLLFAVALLAVATPLRALWLEGPWWLSFAVWGAAIAALAAGRQAE